MFFPQILDPNMTALYRCSCWISYPDWRSFFRYQISSRYWNQFRKLTILSAHPIAASLILDIKENLIAGWHVHKTIPNAYWSEIIN